MLDRNKVICRMLYRMNSEYDTVNIGDREYRVFRENNKWSIRDEDTNIIKKAKDFEELDYMLSDCTCIKVSHEVYEYLVDKELRDRYHVDVDANLFDVARIISIDIIKAKFVSMIVGEDVYIGYHQSAWNIIKDGIKQARWAIHLAKLQMQFARYGSLKQWFTIDGVSTAEHTLGFHESRIYIDSIFIEPYIGCQYNGILLYFPEETLIPDLEFHKCFITPKDLTMFFSVDSGVSFAKTVNKKCGVMEAIVCYDNQRCDFYIDKSGSFIAVVPNENNKKLVNTILAWNRCHSKVAYAGKPSVPASNKWSFYYENYAEI